MTKSEGKVEPTPLALTLHPPGTTLTGGRQVNTLPGAAATIDTQSETVALGVALGGHSRAEDRYLVDQVMRSVSKLMPVGPVTLRAATGVDDDTVTAVGLDVHHSSDGQVSCPDHPQVAERIAKVAGYEDLCRAWVNEDPSTRTSLAIARDVSEWGNSQTDVSVRVLTETELTEAGCRLLLAVGGGSEASPARLVLAHYTPGGKKDRPLALVGKGITFDSGGINVKPYEAFVPMMKNDMAGSALAWSAFKALVENGHPEPLLLVIPTCENAIDARSMRPGSVVKSFSGIDVRIDHTDAEGRLVLADGMAYACKEYKPHQLISFATLTTHALIAYGPYATPVHFADADLERRLSRAAERAGEDLHFFPRRVWHAEANRDPEAELRNTGRLNGDAWRGGGSRNAAHFLTFFVDAPLCHFDIFASAWNWAGDAPGSGYGATGSPLRSVLGSFELQ